MQSTRVGEYMVWYENTEEFNELKKEIFTEHRYYLELETAKPAILDLGGHIGMATLYFKRLWPEASVVVCEPVPANLSLLKKNFQENQLENVEIVEGAVAPKAGSVEIQIPTSGEWQSGAGIIPRGWRGVQETSPIRVTAVGINEILYEGVDLVKMDIEGMEYEVTLGADWSKVGAVMMEVHPRVGKRISEIEKVLQRAGLSLERREDQSRYGKKLIMLYGRR